MAKPKTRKKITGIPGRKTSEIQRVSSGLHKKMKKKTVAIKKNQTRQVNLLGTRQGCAALIVIRERTGKSLDQISSTSWSILPEFRKDAARGRKSRGAAGRLARIPKEVSASLSAAAHPVRIKILVKLLEGPAIYRSMQLLTKLKAGPLYHHINQLRLAGLILPKQRDLYELTRGGRNLTMIITALGAVVRDRRRRPTERT